MKRRHGFGCGSLLVAIVVAGGCTGHAGVDGAAGERSTGASPVVTSTAPDGFGTRHVTLTCADAIAASAADAKSLTGEDVGFAGLARAEPAPPRAEDAGLRLPDGLHWYFRKAPLVMRDNSSDVTIAVSGPGQALAWIPSSVWTLGGRPDLGPWAASSVTLHSCPDKAAMFLGGILAADLTTCLLFHVRSAGRAERTIRQRLDGSACTG